MSGYKLGMTNKNDGINRPPQQDNKMKCEDKMKYKLELTQKQIELLQDIVHGAWFDTLEEEGKPRDIYTATKSKVLRNILAKIEELK